MMGDLNEYINELKRLHNKLLDENVNIELIIDRIFKNLQKIQELIVTAEGRTCVTLPLVDVCLDAVRLRGDGGKQMHMKLENPLKTMFSSISTDVYYRHSIHKYYNFINADDCENNVASKKYFINDDISVNVIKNMYVKAYNYFSYIFCKDKVLNESDFYKEEMDKFPPSKEMIPDSNRIITIKKACHLANWWTNINYAHIIFEAMSRLIMMENHGYDGNYMMFDSLDSRNILEILNFDTDRIIWISQSGITYCVEELHVITPVYTGAELTAEPVIDFSARMINCIDINDLKHYPKRIYVKRIGARKIKNEEDILAILNKYNFHTIIPEELSMEEEIKHFYAADIVLSPHGANSANIIYMRPYTCFIECFGQNYITFDWIHVSRLKKINYRLLCVAGLLEEQAGSWLDDYEVNIDLLRLYLSNIIDLQN